jgi:hypothetical protein
MQLTAFPEAEWQSLILDINRPIDYSAMDGESVDSNISEMTSNVRKAIMVDFSPGDYEKAYEVFKLFRDKGHYLGGMILEFLNAEAAKLV